MPRRRRAASDLLKILAAVPWWVSAALAVLSYLLFSAMAAQPVLNGSRLSLLPVIAGALRIVAPVMFALGAVLSAWSRAHKEQLLDDARGEDGDEAIAAMSWREFEWLLGEAYRRQGFSVVETGIDGNDGGIDLVLRRADETTLVQCKHWKVRQVGVQVIRELYGVMADRGADAGIVVTSGSFTAAAVAFARGKAIELVDGPALRVMLAGIERDDLAPLAAPVRNPSSSSPSCDRCGRPMVLRTARRGSNAGRDFWGCTAFPACRGIRDAS